MPTSSAGYCCRVVAELFQTMLTDAYDKDLMLLCSQGLLDISHNYTDYNASAKTSRLFMDEINDTTQRMCDEDAVASGDPHALAFALLEAVCVVMRECVLRQDSQPRRPVQEAVCRYFERSGYWHRGDGTMVSEYYYSRMPLEVLAGMAPDM